MNSYFCYSLLVFLLISLAWSEKVLVLLENMDYKNTYSHYFRSLTTDDYELVFKTSDDPNLFIYKYGEFVYQRIIIFAPRTKEFGGLLSPEILVRFIDAGNDLIVAGGPVIGDAIRQLAAECGFKFPDDNSLVYDYFNVAPTVNDVDGSHILIDPKYLSNISTITGKAVLGKPILYRGINVIYENENRFITTILKGSPTSFVMKTDSKSFKHPLKVTDSINLIAALQARNNARVLVVGSLEFFSNAFFEAEVGLDDKSLTGNYVLAKRLTDWTFKRSGVLRVASVTHHKEGQVTTPRAYTIKNQAVFQMRIEELVDKEWKPFCSNDMQLEFVRIDPFIRETMTCQDGTFTLNFKVPDVYGVFKFVVDYLREGYTHIYITQQIPVHPLRHDEYERFIPSAYPYYAGAFSMMVGVLCLSFVILYHSDIPKKKTD